MEVQDLYLAGEWLTAPETIEVLNPFNGETIALASAADGELAQQAVDAAHEAFEETRALPVHAKFEILDRIAANLLSRREELAETICRESGKPIKTARVEAARAVRTFEAARAEVLQPVGDTLDLSSQPASEGRLGIVRRFPVGPVLGITPFNFPLNLVAHKVAPAIAAGCPFVIKPSSAAPLSSLALARAIEESGWPKKAASFIPATAEGRDALVADKRIKKISFTGSAEVGWSLKRASDRKRVTLELGGNAAAIVDAGVDLEDAAARLVAGAFAYSGQVCISVQRIYVHETVFDDFLDLFLEKTKKLKVGGPANETTDIGPLIEPGEADRILEWIEEAVKAGAKLMTGAERVGNAITPAVLTNVDPQSRISRMEAFGPIAVVTPYKEFSEAIEMVNDSDYGLQAGVFSGDLSKVMDAFDSMEVGGLIINDSPMYRVDEMPYGGTKDSGVGREGLRWAIREMTEEKLLVLKRG